MAENSAAEILTVTPGRPLVGELGSPALPGDKSLSHRAALLAAMADGESWIENFQVSGVTRPMLEALRGAGVPWNLEGTRLQVQGIGLRPAQPMQPLQVHCGNSATTLRLLAGALAAWGLPAVLDGTPGLRRRPMGRIVEPLQQMGVPIQAQPGGGAPLVLQAAAARPHGLHYRLPVASAQVKSCLLLAALAADDETLLEEDGPSRDHTERMLAAMGAGVESWSEAGWYRTRLRPPADGCLKPLAMTLPGDISAAAFLLVAALITPGSRLLLRQVGLNPTRTGLLDALQAMGADLRITNRRESGGEPLGDLEAVYSLLHGVQVSGELVVRMIDEFPAFAVAAAFASGMTEVRDAVELRHKESDRISALGEELCKLGVGFAETPDGFTIQGGRPLHGARVNPHGDHRLAMSLAVAGLAAGGPVVVDSANIIDESFPEFARVLQQLGGQAQRTV